MAKMKTGQLIQGAKLLIDGANRLDKASAKLKDADVAKLAERVAQQAAQCREVGNQVLQTVLSGGK